jgi:SAM-dependent methyltransferase
VSATLSAAVAIPGDRGLPRGHEALVRLLAQADVRSVLDVGSGSGEHAEQLRAAGREVFTIALDPPADHVGDFLAWESPRCDFDAIWACHVLEHQVDPGAFLRECRRRLKPGGWLAVTVPPAKHEVVGGHVTLWNAGILLYQLILAGFDCREAAVGTYGYNISVLVQNRPAALPALTCDAGDVDRLRQWFPVPVAEGFDGELPNVRWDMGPRMTVVASPQRPVPKRIAILGLGPSVSAFVELTKRAGGRRKHFDEVWGINAIGDVIACDRVFHMDDVRIQEIRAAARPESNIAQMLKWLRTHPGPVYTSREHPDYPGLKAFPLAEVVASTKYAYFNSTAAYPIALAIHLGVERISVFGNDFTYPNAHQAEKGRACVEFWMGYAAACGIEIQAPMSSTLMDTCAPEDRLYGYDTLEVAFARDDAGELVTTMTPRTAPLPSAEEIEHRYDHTRHPNAIVDAARAKEPA